jgi:hypothetical protein
VEDETTYKEMKSRFFGIQFTDGLIQVKTLACLSVIIILNPTVLFFPPR